MRRPRLEPSLLALALLGSAGCALSNFDGLSGGAPDGEEGTERDASRVERGEAGIQPAADGALEDGADDAAGLIAEHAADSHDAGASSPAEATGALDAAPVAGDARADALAANDALALADTTSTPDAMPAPDAAPQPVGDSACYTRFSKTLSCDGFESAPMDPPWWDIVKSGDVGRSTARRRRGDGALAARSISVGGSAFIGRLSYPSIKQGKIYLRAYVYVPSGAPVLSAVVLTMSQQTAPYGGLSVSLKDTGIGLDVAPKGAGVDVKTLTADPPVRLVRDQWICIQVEADVSATQGSARLSANGQLAAGSAGPLNTLPLAGYEGINAGLVYTSVDQPPLEVFIDELVTDVMPIPCD